jgi:YfiH family protein
MMHIVGRNEARMLGTITYFEAPPLKALGLVNHAFCTKSGGFVREILSSPASDTKRAEEEARLARTFGFEREQLITMDQVHGDRIWIIDKPLQSSRSFLNHPSDALLTDQPDIAIGVLTADCVPILLVEPKRSAIGIIHAGWRGTLLGIAQKALHKMTHHFGTHPEDLLVAIGPSIGECCYEVDEAVMGPFRSSQWNWQAFSKHKEKDRWFLNLARANIDQMRDSGMRDERCCWIRVCTRCHTDILFSYRAEGPGTGEQISFIQLRGDIDKA